MEKRQAKRQENNLTKHFALFTMTSSTEIKKDDVIFKINFLSISMYIQYICENYFKIYFFKRKPSFKYL